MFLVGGVKIIEHLLGVTNQVFVKSARNTDVPINLVAGEGWQIV